MAVTRELQLETGQKAVRVTGFNALRSQLVTVELEGKGKMQKAMTKAAVY